MLVVPVFSDTLEDDQGHRILAFIFRTSGEGYLQQIEYSVPTAYVYHDQFRNKVLIQAMNSNTQTCQREGGR